MTPRPCTWPDGGCGEPIIDVTTIAGKRQVLNPIPAKGVVLVWGDDHERLHGTQGNLLFGSAARVVDVYTDHHATCATWLARVERERAAKAGRP